MNRHLHAVAAELHLQAKEFEAARATLAEALKLPSFPAKPRLEAQGSPEGEHQKGVLPGRPYELCFKVTDLERIEAYALMATAASKCSRADEARQILLEASRNYADGPLAGRLVLANAGLATEAGDMLSAMRLLKSIGPSTAFYITAQKTLASMFLREKKDKTAFARCFIDVAEVQPTAENFLAIGSALLKINEPCGAVEAFEKALNLRPGDPKIARHIGERRAQHHFLWERDTKAALSALVSRSLSDPRCTMVTSTPADTCTDPGYQT